jgi:cytochrome c-type biogenesis protein CcmH/NrfG
MTSTSELQQRAIDFARTGDFGPQALATNLELARVAPANEGAWTRLSRCYMEGGQLDEATAALDAALQINPQNTIARSLMMEVTRRRIAAAGPVPPAVAGARPRA